MRKGKRALLRGILIGILSIIPITGLAITSGVGPARGDTPKQDTPIRTPEERQDIRGALNPEVTRAGLGVDVSVPGADAAVGIDADGPYAGSVEQNVPESGAYWTDEEVEAQEGPVVTDEVEIKQTGVGVGVYYGRPYRYYRYRPHYGYRYYRYGPYYRPYRYQGYYPYYEYYQYHNYNYGW